jgi:hypothetical protein
MAALDPTAWNEPLPREERDALFERIATFVARRGLGAAAVWALEMHKPLAFLGSQAVIVGGPLFGPVVGLEGMQTLSRVLAEEGAIEVLIVRIEEKTVERETPATPDATLPS